MKYVKRKELDDFDTYNKNLFNIFYPIINVDYIFSNPMKKLLLSNYISLIYFIMQPNKKFVQSHYLIVQYLYYLKFDYIFFF